MSMTEFQKHKADHIVQLLAGVLTENSLTICKDSTHANVAQLIQGAAHVIDSVYETFPKESPIGIRSLR